jgi:uncharacterized membrane protein YeiB
VARTSVTYFRLGPLKWLWRAAVYWKLPQMRNAPAGTSDTRAVE